MGLDPIPFLAVPRVIAAAVTAPILTVFMNVWGLVGGGIVFLSLGFPPITYIQRLLLRGSAVDLVFGLVKAMIFGVIVASVGCLQGFRTGAGARAVGESTTRSVVLCITLVIAADGVLAVVYYALGL